MAWKKIAVVGNSGAGKSTLSKKLGQTLGIDVFTIDKIYWEPGWKIREQEEFRKLHDLWLENESWIIDGIGYWEEMALRIRESDLVIFLNVPVDVCRERAKQRIDHERIEPNPDVAPGCAYGDVEALQIRWRLLTTFIVFCVQGL